MAWGNNDYGQCDVPEPNEGFLKICGGWHSTVAIRFGSTTAVAFSGFHAGPKEGAILLDWETEADESLDGFYLYRAELPGDLARIIDNPLPPYTRTYEDRKIEPGKKYLYVVTALTEDGREVYAPEATVYSITPALALFQNVPNPFNPRTTIGFFLADQGHVSLIIYDTAGRFIRRLADMPMQPGRHQIDWDGRDEKGRAVSSGVYFYRLTTGKQTSARRMVLLR